MKKTEKEKVNSTIRNLKTALRIMIMNSSDESTKTLLETKIAKYQIILKKLNRNDNNKRIKINFDPLGLLS